MWKHLGYHDYYYKRRTLLKINSPNKLTLILHHTSKLQWHSIHSISSHKITWTRIYFLNNDKKGVIASVPGDYIVVAEEDNWS